MPPFTISNPLALVEADQPARTILWNISPAGKLTFFSLAAVVLLVFCLTLLWRIRIWLGGHLDGFELRRIGNHLTAFFVDAVALRKTNRDTRACLLHSLIFFGFLSLVFATLVVGIDYHFDISLFRGIFSQLVSLGADLGGAALFAGCALAMSRRLESGQTFRTAKADLVLLLVLAFLVVQGFLVEALRIARLGEPHPLFSPAGALLSLFFWGLSPVSLERLHLFLWWLHALSALGFIVLLPHTKLLHMFAASANIFFAGTRPALPALDSPGDLEEIIADAGSGAVELNSRIGCSTARELTFRQRLSLNACTACARCEECCPAARAGSLLSPMRIIVALREHVSPQPFARHCSVNVLEDPAVRRVGSGEETPLCAGVLSEEVFWDCTTCGACTAACPVGVDHVNLVCAVRRAETLLCGRMPLPAQSMLRSLELRGNPFGETRSRLAWAAGLHVPVLSLPARVEVLYWVGCAAAFDKRAQGIARAMVNILNASKMSWGVLGNQESCTGDAARRLGEERLYQQLAKQNIDLLAQVEHDVLVVHCPHCLQAFVQEYPQIGSFPARASTRILHHSEFIHELLQSGRIKTAPGNFGPVTYHDPCYLGRANGIFSAPRQVLQAASCAVLTEMSEAKDASFCCGAGGGHSWFDLAAPKRINTLRAQQVLETKAETLVTACPFCLPMLDDGLKACRPRTEVQSIDLAELVASCLLTQESAQRAG